MAVAPQKLREIVFQLLYSEDFGVSTDPEMVELLMHELRVSKSVMKAAVEAKIAIHSLRERLDRIIVEQAKSYELDRIPSVERNILRLGIYELTQAPTKLPPQIVIAEAIRLARKFATAEAALFINAILDAVYKSRC